MSRSPGNSCSAAPPRPRDTRGAVGELTEKPQKTTGSLMEKRPALGKGLSALIPDAPAPPGAASIEVDIDRLTPNEFQPRVHVDETRLRELADSIRSNGVIQPIIVRKVEDRFQIIAGERRWRAAGMAGLVRVPVVVREV